MKDKPMIGYARVSTDDQDLRNQRAELAAVGIDDPNHGNADLVVDARPFAAGRLGKGCSRYGRTS